MAETKKLRSEIRDLNGTILELKGNIEELKGILIEKIATIESFKLKINAIRDTYDTNLECIKNLLAEQTVFLKQLTENMHPVPKFATMFPINTQEELDSLESHICTENQSQMVGTVLHFIKNGGFKSNLLSILGEKVILDHNLDGKQRKTPLIRYTKLMKVFFGAAQKLGVSERECTQQLRYAMKSVKNRYHKASCLKRKCTEALPEQSEEEINNIE